MFRQLFAVFVISLVCSLSCGSQEYLVSIKKISGKHGEKETFSISGKISGADKVLVEGQAVASNTEAVTEHCLTATTDGVYTIELKHADNKLWSKSSFLTITNKDGIVVFSGRKYSATEKFEFTLSYITPEGSNAKFFWGFDMGEWWKRDYEMSSDWVTKNTAEPRTVEGNHIYRYNFGVENLDKYSHVVIRIYYRYGVAVWLNDQRLYIDHLQELEGDAVYIYTMAIQSFTDYTWKDIIVPASMLESTNNLLCISAHYTEFTDYTVKLTFSIFGVYSGYVEEQCTAIPFNYIEAGGIKTMDDNKGEYVVDGKEGTQAVFNGASMYAAFKPAVPTWLSEYTVTRYGDNKVGSWDLSYCDIDVDTCSTWKMSSTRTETITEDGTTRYHCEKPTNKLAYQYRFVLKGDNKDVSVNEFTGFVCGVATDITMYSTSFKHVTGTDDITMTPEYPQEGATYSIYPELPSTVTLNEQTGEIKGSTSGFRHFTTFTIIRKVDKVRTKFILTVLSDKEDIPTTEPPTIPPEVPTTQPEPTATPNNSPNWIIIVAIIVIVVLVVIIVIIVVISNKKGKKAKLEVSNKPQQGKTEAVSI